jgi:ParB/RepB/Spo0J family partition protein
VKMSERLAKKMAGFSTDVQSAIADRSQQSAERQQEPTSAPASDGVQELNAARPLPRTGIGRGAFFQSRIAELERELEQARSTGGAVVAIPLNLIDDNPEQVDVVYDSAYIATLAEAWKAGSEPPPIEVRARGDRYVLIAGHHRKRAAGLAGQVEIKSRILAIDDDRAVDMVFISNSVRKRPDWEQAKFFARRLLDKNHDGSRRFKSQAALARYFGVDASYLAKQLKMLDLPDGVTALLRDKPDLINATTADVILQAVAAHPSRIGDIVECTKKLESGTPQTAMKGLLEQKLATRNRGRPAGPVRTFGGKRSGFVRTINARRIVISAGAEVDLTAFQQEVDEFLAKLVEKQ